MIEARRDLRDAWIARRCIQLFDLWTLRELPAQRVLAATRADDENPHVTLKTNTAGNAYATLKITR